MTVVEVRGEASGVDEVLGELAGEVDDGGRDGGLGLVDDVHRAVPRDDGLVGELPGRGLGEQPAVGLDPDPQPVLAHDPAGVRVVGGDRRHVVEHDRAVLGRRRPDAGLAQRGAAGADSRSDSSPAALRVKVRPSTSSGRTRSLATSQTTRAAMVSVFPDPAPATTSERPQRRLDDGHLLGRRGVGLAERPGEVDGRPAGDGGGVSGHSCRPSGCAGQESLTWQVPHCEPGVAVKLAAGHGVGRDRQQVVGPARLVVVGERDLALQGRGAVRGPAELQEGGPAGVAPVLGEGPALDGQLVGAELAVAPHLLLGRLRAAGLQVDDPHRAARADLDAVDGAADHRPAEARPSSAPRRRRGASPRPTPRGGRWRAARSSRWPGPGHAARASPAAARAGPSAARARPRRRRRRCRRGRGRSRARACRCPGRPSTGRRRRWPAAPTAARSGRSGRWSRARPAPGGRRGGGAGRRWCRAGPTTAAGSAPRHLLARQPREGLHGIRPDGRARGRPATGAARRPARAGSAAGRRR